MDEHELSIKLLVRTLDSYAKAQRTDTQSMRIMTRTLEHSTAVINDLTEALQVAFARIETLERAEPRRANHHRRSRRVGK